MFIDCSKLPNPADPQVDDVYTSPGSTHVLVVTSAPYRDEDTYYMRLVRDGTMLCIHAFDFPAILTSLALRPWGRLDRSNADGRPKISDDPQLVAQRLEAVGPHLRALREQYGLSMGDLSRALGCPPARLSMLELAQPDPVREGAGVREDEGRAALAELLAETTAAAFTRHVEGVVDERAADVFRVDVWEAIHTMLATTPAIAAMSTIMRAVEKSNVRGAGLWDLAGLAHLLTVKLMPMVKVASWEFGKAVSAALASPEAQCLIATASPAARVFRPGDRITYKGKAATVREVDHEEFDLLVTFESGETSAVPMTDVQLVNANVAIETARAGLAHLLTTELLKIPAHLSSVDPDEFQSVIEGHLASDEAQRLIRLHG